MSVLTILELMRSRFCQSVMIMLLPLLLRFLKRLSALFGLFALPGFNLIEIPIKPVWKYWSFEIVFYRIRQRFLVCKSSFLDLLRCFILKCGGCLLENSRIEQCVIYTIQPHEYFIANPLLKRKLVVLNWNIFIGKVFR